MRKPVVGIAGGGQLARMMVQASIPLDIEFRILATSFSESAAQVCPDILLGTPGSVDDLRDLATQSDITTFDHELVDVAALRTLADEGMLFAPSPLVMEISQSKRLQRALFDRLGLPNPQFTVLMNDTTFPDAEWEYPVVVKADRGGYDGRGVWIATDDAEVRRISGELQNRGIIPLVEEKITIERELAVLGARSKGGQSAIYPLCETRLENGILIELLAPAPGSIQADLAAQSIWTAIADELDVVGLLAVELFETGGKLIVNEIATRPHNTGHHTIEAAQTSQFEQHLRAILDWPLGSAAMVTPAAMVNVIGNDAGIDPGSNLASALAMPGVHVHLYGKKPRPGRKLGHVTVLDSDLELALAVAREASAILMNKG